MTIRVGKTEMGQGVRTSLPRSLPPSWARIGRGCGSSKRSRDRRSRTWARRAAEVSSTHGLRCARRLPPPGRCSCRRRRRSFGVPREQCTAENGFVVHSASGRRATFGSLVATAAELSVPAKPVLRPTGELPLIGTRLKRTDTPAIVRGQAVYGLDVRIPNMKFAVIARPPAAGATARRWNDAAARAVPGVTTVTQVPSGFAIVASNTWAAMQGRKALAVEWNTPASAASANSSAFVAQLEHALATGKLARHEGDANAALSGAARTLTATFHWPFQAHAAMEPLSAVADVRADRCDLWLGTQRANGVQALAAHMLGLSPGARDRSPDAHGRRVWTTHRDRQCAGSDRGVTRDRSAGAGRLVARRRHPARHVQRRAGQPHDRRSR